MTDYFKKITPGIMSGTTGPLGARGGKPSRPRKRKRPQKERRKKPRKDKTAKPKSSMTTKKGEQRVGAIPGEKFFHGTRTEIGEGGDYGGIHLGTRKAAHDRLRQTYWLRSISKKGRIDEATVNLKKTLGTKENPVDEDELFNIVNLSSKLKNLKARGIDGIIYRNDVEDPGSISVLALNKSSISNYIKGKSRDEKKTLRDTYLKLYQGMED